MHSAVFLVERLTTCPFAIHHLKHASVHGLGTLRETGLTACVFYRHDQRGPWPPEHLKRAPQFSFRTCDASCAVTVCHLYQTWVPIRFTGDQ
jgi:hypothetical protein